MAWSRAVPLTLLLAFLLAACGTAPGAGPPDAPSGIPPLPAQLAGLPAQSPTVHPPAGAAAGMQPAQVYGCSYIVAWNGYDGCWRETGVWYYTWPYGYGFSYCWFIIYYSTGEWGTWQVSTDWAMCNQ